MVAKTNLRRENDKWQAGNAEDKRREDVLCDEERNRFNKCSARGAIASVVDDEGRETRREGSERGWGGKVCLNAREREDIAAMQRNERDGETTNPRLRHVERA